MKTCNQKLCSAAVGTIFGIKKRRPIEWGVDVIGAQEDLTAFRRSSGFGERLGAVKGRPVKSWQCRTPNAKRPQTQMAPIDDRQ